MAASARVPVHQTSSSVACAVAHSRCVVKEIYNILFFLFIFFIFLVSRFHIYYSPSLSFYKILLYTIARAMGFLYLYRNWASPTEECPFYCRNFIVLVSRCARPVFSSVLVLMYVDSSVSKA